MNLHTNILAARPLPPVMDTQTELKMHVLKQRWIGNDAEAERLLDLLRQMWPATLLLSPPETD